MNRKVVIWRDKVDANLYHFGSLFRGTVMCYGFTIRVGNIQDMFGGDAAIAAQGMLPGGEPIEVTLTLAFKGE